MNAVEFFAGIGLASIGLSDANIKTIWSNDVSRNKRTIHRNHFGDEHPYDTRSVADLSAKDVPDAKLAWASSPCTDLSLAGLREGLSGERSGTLWHFLRILREKKKVSPENVIIENVNGLATSRKGRDLAGVIAALNDLGYSVDTITLDAARFVPQSRPRLFILATKNPPPHTAYQPSTLRPNWLRYAHTTERTTHRTPFPDPPPMMNEGLTRIINPTLPTWDNLRTEAFFQGVHPEHKNRIKTTTPHLTCHTAYRRTRKGQAVWEIRQDNIAGCLRTASGGSSRQALIITHGNDRTVRWLHSREYAALMGTPDYKHGKISETQAINGYGDAVVAPVVTWIARNAIQH